MDELHDYFRNLFDRWPEAFVPERRAIRFQDGEQPEYNKCHENVSRWIAENPGHAAVRGWIVVSYDKVGGALFNGHSIVCGPDGRVFDITPSRAESLRFIRHPGDEASFQKITDKRAEYSFVPF